MSMLLMERLSNFPMERCTFSNGSDQSSTVSRDAVVSHHTFQATSSAAMPAVTWFDRLVDHIAAAIQYNAITLEDGTIILGTSQGTIVVFHDGTVRTF